MNGRPVRVRVDAIPGQQDVRPEVEANLNVEGKAVLEIDFDPAVEILPPANESRTGDPNRGLRIIRQEFSPGRLTVVCEGLSGERYRLGVMNSSLIKSVNGAVLEHGEIQVDFSGGPPGVYARRDIILNLK